MLEKLSQLPTGKRIIKNFFSLTTANLFGQLFAFISTAYLARILNASGFGKIAFVQGIIAYFALITNFGLRTIGVREIAKNRNEIKRYVSNLLALRLTLAITSFILLLIFLVFVNKPIDYKILIALFGLTLFPQVLLLDWAFEGTERMEFVGIARIMRPAIYLLLVLFFVKSPQDLLNIPLLILASSLVIVILLSYIFIRNYGWFKLAFDLKLWKRFILLAVPLGLSVLLLQINGNIDIIMLGFMKSDEVVGWYSAAYKIILLLMGLGGFLSIAIFPLMSRLYHESVEKLKKLIYYYFKVTVFWGLPMAVGGVVLAPKLITLIYGNDFQGSILAFRILLGYLFLGYATAPFFFLFQASGKMKYFLYTAAAAALTNLGLNIILIPKYGLIAAASTTVISNLVIFVMLYIYSSRKIVYVSISRSFIVAPIASLAMGVLLYSIDLNLFANFLIGFVFYIALVFLLKGITIAELKYLLAR